MEATGNLKEKLIKACEFVSFAVILLFALLPSFALVNPPKYGKIFIFLGIVAIAVLVITILVRLYVALSRGTDDDGRGCIKRLASSVVSAFSGNRHFLLLFIAYILCVISACFAPDTERAFRGTDFRVDGVFMYTVFAALFVFGSCIKGESMKKTLFAVFAVSLVLNSAVVLMQHFGVIGTANADKCPVELEFLKNFFDDAGIRVGHFYKGLTGGFYNSNHVGYFLAMGCVMIAAMMIRTRKMLFRILLALFYACEVWILTLNNTFGCYIAVFAGGLIFAALIFTRTREPEARFKAALPLFIFMIVTIIMTACGQKTVISNIDTLGGDIVEIAENSNDAEGAGSGRWPLWVETVDMIREKPLLGFGPDNLNPEYKSRGLDMTRAHNEILEHSVANGILFSVFYFGGVFYIVFRRIRRFVVSAEGYEYLVPLIMCITYMISALMGVYLFYTACHFTIMLSLLKDR